MGDEMLNELIASRYAWKKVAELLEKSYTYPSANDGRLKCIHCLTVYDGAIEKHSPDCPIEQLRKLKEGENG